MLAREVSRVVQTDARERYFRINQLRNARGGGGILFFSEHYTFSL